MRRCTRKPALSSVVVLFVTGVSAAPAAAGGFWPGENGEAVGEYPRPAPVETVARDADIPRLDIEHSAAESPAAGGPRDNKAVRLRVVGLAEETRVFDTAASPGSTFLVLRTTWENIHPKQRVSKDALDGKADRTMGVGGLSAGGRSSKPAEYVDVDVAYKVPKLNNHVYALVDGQAIPPHPAMAQLPDGIDPGSGIAIGKHGETVTLALAFLVPADAENIALQVFDYSNGHLLVPVRGSTDIARRPDGAGDEILDDIKTDTVELAAHSLTFADSYGDDVAGTGWQFAIVGLGGKSVSEGGGMGRILQFNPTRYTWVTTDGGYLYYASGGSTDAQGNIRFTPEVYQRQEVAFRVPDTADRLSMGLRINRDVFTLSLSRQAPQPMPGSRLSHADGDVMEILLYGTRQEDDYFVVDLGIKPVVEGQGLEVRTAQQFLLQTPAGELRPDVRATGLLQGHPPEPFVVPPGVEVRFELAYKPVATPSALRVRGFRSEGRFDL